MAIVTDDNTATPAGRGADANAVERVLAAAVRGGARAGDLLDEASGGPPCRCRFPTMACQLRTARP